MGQDSTAYLQTVRESQLQGLSLLVVPAAEGGCRVVSERDAPQLLEAVEGDERRQRRRSPDLRSMRRQRQLLQAGRQMRRSQRLLLCLRDTV